MPSVRLDHTLGYELGFGRMAGIKTSSNAKIPGHISPRVLHFTEWQIENFRMNAREIGKVQGLS
jgi:hypothetical protein